MRGRQSQNIYGQSQQKCSHESNHLNLALSQVLISKPGGDINLPDGRRSTLRFVPSHGPPESLTTTPQSSSPGGESDSSPGRNRPPVAVKSKLYLEAAASRRGVCSSAGGRIYPAEIRFNLLESFMASNYLEYGPARTIPAGDVNQDSLYEQAADTYGSSLDRLARAYELDAEVRRDLLQEIHFELWRSFAHFDGRCSLRTWVYRVAHNVATGHMIRQRRIRDRLVSIETIEALPGNNEQAELAATQAEALDQLSMLIQRLKPLDRQIIVSYLEGMDASSIGELTGLSPANIAMKVHRIKNILKRWFVEGGLHAK
jgi:RNA polymerase sigma-70 factor, ECF subfamily